MSRYPEYGPREGTGRNGSFASPTRQGFACQPRPGCVDAAQRGAYLEVAVPGGNSFRRWKVCRVRGTHVYTMERFEQLYRKHVQAVFRFAMHCVGRKDVAQDLTAEAFLALYRNVDQIDESLLPGWLITVTRNRARDFWRHEAVEQKYALAQPAASASPPEESVEPFATWLLACPELKPVHRICLTLRYVHGMTRAEIAAKIGRSETQVKGYLQYSLHLLRNALRENKKS